MNTLIICILFVIGIVLIVKGGDFFVDASVWIAEVLGIPKFLVGATVVSFATTLPELLVSVIAAIEKKPDMAAGNAIGSVTANIGIIMSIALIAMPAFIKRSALLVKGILMLICPILLFVFSADNAISLTEAVILLFIFGIYMADNITSAKKLLGSEKEIAQTSKKETITNILKFVIGICAIVIGADLLVDNGSELARIIGVPEGIIAVTLVAIGTSLPELVTTITAIVKKQSALSVGNIIGANIIDLTLIMPICSVIYHGSIPVSRQTASLDLPSCAIVTLISIIPALIFQKFKRWQGIALIVVYAVYLVILCSNIM